MHISVGIPTWNRAKVLKRTLTQLKEVNIPEGVSWEVLVVDNNSTDSTQEILNLFKDVLPLKPLFEAKQGRSHALNLAIENAGGDYIIWTDDDIIVDTNWIVEYHRAFVDHPDSYIYGGLINPLFEGTPPDWLRQALPVIGGVYGKCEPVEGPISTEDPFLPFGGNMAVKSKIQRSYLFDEKIGRKGGMLFAGEESKIIRTMLENGIEGRWVPTAKVEHIIPTYMQTIAHIRRYFHDWGVSAGIGKNQTENRFLFKNPLWLWRQAIQCEIKYWVGRILRRSPVIWIQDLRHASYAWGALRKRAMKVPKKIGSLP